MDYKEIMIMIALIFLLAVSIYQAFEVANLKSVVEKKFASEQANLNANTNQPIYPGFEEIPTTGQGCVA